MIFGKTWRHKQREENLRTIKKIFGVQKFAWLPVRLSSGQYAWLTTYYKYSQWDCDWLYGASPVTVDRVWIVPSPYVRRELTLSSDYVYKHVRTTAEQLATWVQEVQEDVR